MFFWITDGDAVNFANFIESLDNLGEAGFARRHLILGERGVISKILQVQGLSRKSSAYFKSVLAKYSQVAVLGKLLKKINIVPDSIACHQQGIDWVVPLSSFSDTNLLESTILVVEHMYDYQVILFLAQIHLREKGIFGMGGLRFTPVSGGGGGTSLTLVVHQRNSSSLGLCVVDSDRPHVHGALGSTAKSCRKSFSNSWRWSLHILNARELENVVPPELYAQSDVGDRIVRRELYNEKNWPLHGFMDIKKGDRLCRFRNLNIGDKSHEATHSALSAVSWDSICANLGCSDEKCTMCEPDDGLLARFSSKLDNHKIAGCRVFPQRVPALDHLLAEVASFGLASKWSLT